MISIRLTLFIYLMVIGMKKEMRVREKSPTNSVHGLDNGVV